MKSASKAGILVISIVLLSACGVAPVRPESGPPTAEVALARMLDGHARFVAGRAIHPNADAARRAGVAGGQKPFAIVVGCSDSRVGPEVVFDQGLGDLFVIRTAGEVVTDVGLASIEYAVEHLGSPLVLVLGHERCGAVSAAVAGGEPHGHLPSILGAIGPAVAASRDEPGDAVENAVRAQVRRVVRQLSGSEPVLAAAVRVGGLRVVGARYDLDTGRVEILE